MTARRHLADVAAASAALLYDLLPEIMKLPPEDQYQRLVTHMCGCLTAYEDVPEEFWPPEPSDN